MANNYRPSWADVRLPGYAGMNPELELGGDSDLMVSIAACRLLAAGRTVMADDENPDSIPDDQFPASEFFDLVERICNIDAPLSKCEKLYAVRPLAERCGMIVFKHLSDSEIQDAMADMIHGRTIDLDDALDSMIPLLYYKDKEQISATFEQECEDCGRHFIARYHAVRSDVTLPSGTVLPCFVPAETPEELIGSFSDCCQDHIPVEDSETVNEWLQTVNLSLINELRHIAHIEISDADYNAYQKEVMVGREEVVA